MKKFLMFVFVLVSFGCTDAEFQQYIVLGDPGHITCYSGGDVIFEGDSTGKIQTEQGSDGWFASKRSEPAS